MPQAEVDSSGHLSLVNDAFCELVGRSREELLGMHASELYHDDDRRAGSTMLSSLLSGEQGLDLSERVLRHSDGSPRPVAVDISSLTDDEGAVKGIVGHLHDLRPLRAAERARQRQDDLTDAFARLANDLALVGDADGTLVHVSPAVTRTLGYEVLDLLAASGWDFVHPDDLEAVQQTYRSVVDTGVTATMLLRIRSATGDWRWVEETCRNMLDTSIGGIVCNLVDVTERVEAEQALRRSEQHHRSLAEAAEEGILAVDSQGRTVFANARMAGILGIGLDELHARPALHLLSPAAAQQAASRLTARSQRGSDRYEVTYEHPDGRARQLWVSAAPWATDGDTDGAVCLVSDVTEERRAMAEATRLALQDRLTGLASRALLLDRLERLTLRPDLHTLVLLIDLDHFKLVNHAHGHAAGDELLVRVADRLRAVISARDTVARLGGDEFVILVEDGDLADGRRLADEVLAALSAPVVLAEGEPVPIGASVGVALGTGSDVVDLLRQADAALYAAKAGGRGQACVYDREAAEQGARTFSIAADLRGAFADETLELHYQPIVEIATGRVVGLEALVRWEHPDRGAVEPELFVEVAEVAGLSFELDTYVLARAMREFGRFRAAGHVPRDAMIAINLSASSLRGGELEERARACAHAAGVPTRQVALEITETAIMDEPHAAIAMLRRLREAGFQIAIDDFGTGYSSLAYLRDLPVTELKIDRSFIRDLTTHADALAIAASIVDLGKAVGVTVVAEGVETLAQAAELQRLGCLTAQGWLWSRALSVAELAGSGSLRQPFAVEVPVETRGRRPRTLVTSPVLPEHGLNRMLELHAQGSSPATIASALNSEGYKTPNGARWHRTSVGHALALLPR